MLIDPGARRERLLEVGVPEGFLDFTDNPEAYGDLQFLVGHGSAQAAYFYIPELQLENYEVLRGCEVTPVYDGSNSDSFCVHLSSAAGSRFVDFYLECPDEYHEFPDPLTMVANFLIRAYGFIPETGVPELANIGQRLGFGNAFELFRSLAEADEMGARATSQSDADWRQRNLPGIVQRCGVQTE